MSYTKTNWVDNFTPLSAENLNHIEEGISEIGDIAKQPSGADKTGLIDSTEILQSKIDTLVDGDILWIKGIYKVSQLNFIGKTNIEIDGKGVIVQALTATDTYSDAFPRSSKSLMVIDSCSNIMIGNVTLKPIHEAIYVVNSPNTYIRETIIDGQNTSKYSGIFINSTDVTVSKCSIKNCGVMPIWNGTLNPYSFGNGIHVSGGYNIKILNCDIQNNGRNGVYTFSSGHIDVVDNVIKGNGMSGIQFAFAGDLTTNTHYKVLDNTIENNYSDGLDINNTSNTLFDTHVIIKNNHFKHNGFIGANKTQDGSGIATLRYVKNVIIEGNDCYDCCRAGVAIFNCDNIRIGINNIEKLTGSLGEGIYIENSSNILLNGINLKTEIEGIKLYGVSTDITISKCNVISNGSSLVLPTSGATYNTVKINNNNLKGSGTINATVDLVGNYIESTDATAVTISNNLVRIINNTIKGYVYGMQISGRSNILIDKNKLIGTINNGLLITGASSNIKVYDNEVSTPGGSPALYILGSSLEVRLENNTIIGGTGNSLRLELSACGIVYLDNNIYTGTPELGNGVVKNLSWI